VENFRGHDVYCGTCHAAIEAFAKVPDQPINSPVLIAVRFQTGNPTSKHAAETAAEVVREKFPQALVVVMPDNIKFDVMQSLSEEDVDRIAARLAEKLSVTDQVKPTNAFDRGRTPITFEKIDANTCLCLACGAVPGRCPRT
jgi:hypothetical protein